MDDWSFGIAVDFLVGNRCLCCRRGEIACGSRLAEKLGLVYRRILQDGRSVHMHHSIVL